MFAGIGGLVGEAIRDDFRSDLSRNWTHWMTWTGFDGRHVMPYCVRCGVRSLHAKVEPRDLIPCPVYRRSDGTIVEYYGPRRAEYQAIIDSL